MYRHVFPRCVVDGPVDPVPYSHLLNGAVPRKCKTCPNLFEGGCLRGRPATSYLSLDHGACPVRGATEPVLVETEHYVSKVFVPAKCKSCRYLSLERVYGFVCRLDRDAWGHFPRTLDWGSWSPDHPNLTLDSGRSVTPEVLRAIEVGNEAQCIVAFRRSHADATFREARDAFAELRSKLAAIHA